jgi:hypothetical protein
MKHLYLLLFAAFMAASSSFAQRNCGTMDHLHEMEQQDPSLRERMEKIENHTRFMIEQDAEGVTRNTNVITIPVVVHVVYRTSSENISDAQIQSQIQVLNQDFRRLNADASQTLSQFVPIAADVEVQFCLASIDPSGNPTNGITRTSTTVSAHGTNNSVKFTAQGGRNAWPAGSYLNFWVCNIGGGILGYAQFPGGSASTDGTVCDYRYVGTTGTATAPFNKGRTGTHEVGHWLNLRHIWGDGNCSADDLVSDTPTSSSPNYGCSLSTVKCNTLDMVQNYMDYTDDACMNLYSNGQKVRMRALFGAGGARASLLTSNGCGSAAPSCSDGIQNGNETGVDCGGSCQPCPSPSDCLSYCTSQGNNTSDEYIQSVSIGTYTNNSGNNGGYASFSTPTSYQVGQSYNFTLVPTWTGTVYPEYFRIWADWNADGDFNDAAELAYNQGSASTAAQVTGSISIPINAAIGKTTFRVQMKYNAAPTNCESFSWGEVEDYCVNISPAAATCGVPSGLNTTAITSSTATLNWQAVTGASGYTVRARQVGQSAWTTGTTTATSLNYTGLSACTNYEFQVSATCSSLSSNYSPSTIFSSTGCVAQNCDAPTSLSASNISASSATLNWTTVSGAASYNARIRPFGTSTWSTGSVTGNSINFTGLSSCTGYEFQVQAVCSSGLTSSYTASANLITPGCSACAAPAVAYVANITSGSATFNWSTMPGATRYRVRYRLSGTSSWTVAPSTTATSITRSGLLCGATYQYQVRTRCASSWTGYGVTRTFNTAGCNRETEETLLESAATPFDFNLYPNPANSFVYVDLPQLQSEVPLTIRLFDLSGRLVLEQKVQAQAGSNFFTVETSQLIAGLYMVQVSNGSDLAVKRLVISK